VCAPFLKLSRQLASPKSLLVFRLAFWWVVGIGWQDPPLQGTEPLADHPQERVVVLAHDALGSPGSGGVQQNTHMDDVACTADSGAHWVTRHIDFATGEEGLPHYTLVTIADDGDLLFSDLLFSDLLFSNGSTLERFAIGTGGVESLGPVPIAGTILYASGGGAGMLWAGPTGYYPNANPQGHIFTASYA
jgi:hypothetical protein